MDELLSNVARIRQSRRWAVLLYSGGKFAGGIFDGVNEVVHKTLHHYTVRAKQGGGQSAYDASSGGMGGAKSAGASLRRHGEVAIRTEISQLLHGRWRSQLQACQFILVWSPKVHRNIFFNPPPTMPGESDQSYSTNSTGAQNDPANSSCPGPDRLATAACQVGLGMTADDVRVRRIPCRTNEITYSHVKELHKEMSSFYVYDSHANFAFLSQSGRKQLRSLSESGDGTLLETRSGRIIYGPLSLLDPKPEKLTNPSLSVSESDITMTTTEDDTETEPEEEGDNEKPDLKLSDGGNDSATLALDKAMERLSTTNTTTRPELGSEKSQPTNEKSLQEQIDELYTLYHNWHRRVRVAIASGDQVVLRSLLPEICPPTSTQSNANESPSNAVETCLTRSPGSQTPSVEHCSILMNYPLADGRTLLHVAVEFQQEPEVVNLLLQSGCDPTFKDSEGKTPYILAVSL
ncbi:Ankyrin repeat and zinc finger domain-containing protein 1 [Fasciola gigantica]|uniref:Ankyrin repeat and zinc finger domain-containing protein 1 n=1 Tax=Fasciola gigantica TaxID=46835 RepID=A0A504Z4T1_FASGI|nr:Ankyrin repeat and zinc finger domain-containing protein 1 [Fasciola gigantica]